MKPICPACDGDDIWEINTAIAEAKVSVIRNNVVHLSGDKEMRGYTLEIVGDLNQYVCHDCLGEFSLVELMTASKKKAADRKTKRVGRQE